MQSTEQTGPKKAAKPGPDSALFCVALWLKMSGRAADAAQLAHHFASEKPIADSLEVARILQNLGCKARVVDTSPLTLDARLFPIIAKKQDGGFALLAKLERDGPNGRILLQNPGEARANWLALADAPTFSSCILARPKRRTVEAEGRQEFGFFWFLRAARKYAGVLRDCLLASLFVQIFGLLSPLVFMIVIDRVLGVGSLSTLDVLVFALIVVSAFEILLSALRAYLLAHTAERLDLTLGLTIFKHLLSLPLAYSENRRVGDTIARMKELETVRRFITGAGLMLCIDLFFVVVFLSVMFLFSRFLSLIVVCALPFLFAASFLLTPFLRGKLEDNYARNAENQSFLVEAISGIETIKASAAEPRIRRQWEEKLAARARTGFVSGQYANLIQQATAIIGKVLTIALLWFGAREVLAGRLTVGQLIAFNMLSSRVMQPVLRLSQVWKEFQQTRVSLSRIADIFNCQPEPGFTPGRSAPPPITGAVRFEHVSFRYRPGAAFAVDDLSFTIQPGEMVGIVGATGGGKTTLIKLLQRLYVPEQGRVLIDGVDLSQADASWLRRQIGVVMQDGLLFDGSIRDNICLNAPGLDIEAVVAAAKLAGVHDFIIGLPAGYDTAVGERGNQLSTGQRQRLAIARSLANNPAMLIFDEATASLDYESELFIQRNIKEICRGRTAFIVAHRLSTLRFADRILTLEQGRLVENGSPAALLAQGGRFAAFHGLRAGLFSGQAEAVANHG
ncbi:MAG: type I secretion system permease/ATPase [Desulfobulbaceae bacterium]|nr:type I secretion system permease/ATPase [Desulfobulbaceae bacterium]